jgi:hypothetical protein
MKLMDWNRKPPTMASIMIVFLFFLMSIPPYTSAQDPQIERQQRILSNMQACAASLEDVNCDQALLSSDFLQLLEQARESRRQLDALRGLSQDGNLGVDRNGCMTRSIIYPTPFMGNSGEVFILDDNTAWEVGPSYEYMYEYYPTVLICAGSGKMQVDDEEINVRQMEGWSFYRRTNLKGSISGSIQQGRIFETYEGEIYKVKGLTLQLVLALSPLTFILKNGTEYMLIVEGFSDPLICERLL